MSLELLSSSVLATAVSLSRRLPYPAISATCFYPRKPPLTFSLRCSLTPPLLTAASAEHEIDDDAISVPEPISDMSSMIEVRELEELPEQWRRARIAWLCKEIPSHKPAGIIRLLNGQRKWINQEDATYISVHFMRIRENEAGYRVYKWMAENKWFRFDFALATKLAEYLGKERKFAKCRELFDAIICQGRVPSKSTFHSLIIAYLSAPIHGCIEEACGIYNKMIQMGGYKPPLSLHNSLFRALIAKTGGSSKHYLNQAEFIYHNLVTCDFEVHKDVYAGLIWLHSYQDNVDRERIEALRGEMRQVGIGEGSDVLLSIIRACVKGGDMEGTERAWLKLLESGCDLPSQAFVYRMELYMKLGDPKKSLQIFNGMKQQETPPSVAAYHKIIEVMSKSHEVEIAESLAGEFIDNGLKPLMPVFMNMMNMYLDLGMHDKLESAFSTYLSRCRPHRNIYNIYLTSLVRTGKLEKAEEIFNEMQLNGTIGANARSCNAILGAYLSSDVNDKAEKIYNMMCQKKYEVEPKLHEKLEYVFSLKTKVVKRRVSMKLDQEQREILIGFLLGGVRIESDGERRNHGIHFEFNEESGIHSILKAHIHERFYEWLTSSSRSIGEGDEIPNWFSTIMHSYFGFFADNFWLKGQPAIPRLIHRWLSPRVLAYWYMYGGFRASSGDILLKLKSGNRDDVLRIIKTLQSKSLSCRVKRKGRVFWIGFEGSNAVWFWKMVEPFVLESTKDHLAPFSTNGVEEKQDFLPQHGF